MIFIGQSHIMNQLKFILPSLYEDKSRGANFLLKGPSGYGKTSMAISICHYLARKFEVYLGDWTDFKFKERVVFIDEVHLMKTPETLYPLMDLKYTPENHIFILATNENGNLPEALTNRCFEFVFDDYSDEELLLIAMESSGFKASEESYMEVITAGNRNPRKIKSLVDRLSLYFSTCNVDPQTASFHEILESVFSIKGGLDTLCRRYLEVLGDVGGKASLSLLRNILHVDEGTLKNEIEPVLLQKGLIEIRSRGRILI